MCGIGRCDDLIEFGSIQELQQEIGGLGLAHYQESEARTILRNSTLLIRSFANMNDLYYIDSNLINARKIMGWKSIVSMQVLVSALHLWLRKLCFFPDCPPFCEARIVETDYCVLKQ